MKNTIFVFLNQWTQAATSPPHMWHDTNGMFLFWLFWNLLMHFLKTAAKWQVQFPLYRFFFYFALISLWQLAVFRSTGPTIFVELGNYTPLARRIFFLLGCIRYFKILFCLLPFFFSKKEVYLPKMWLISFWWIRFLASVPQFDLIFWLK